MFKNLQAKYVLPMKCHSLIFCEKLRKKKHNFLTTGSTPVSTTKNIPRANQLQFHQKENAQK